MAHEALEAERNPYRPGVGLTPPYLAGREREQARFRRILQSAPEIPANVRLSGLRGIGKTVLLKRFQEIAEEQGWAAITLEIQPKQNNETSFLDAISAQSTSLEKKLSLTSRIRARAGDMLDSVRRIIRVEHDGIEWSIAGDLKSRTRELGELLFSSVDTAQNHKKTGLALFLDEAQLLTDDRDSGGNHTLSTLVAAVSTLQKAQVAVSLVLCGLPTLAVNLLNARTYSERMFQGFEVGSLDLGDARKALTVPLEKSTISPSEDLIKDVLDDVEGYPYFIQLWGAELWEAAKNSEVTLMNSELLEDVRERIFERLDQDFYEPRIAALTPAEQDLLLESRQCPYSPLIVANLNGLSVKSPGNVNVLLGRLVTQNVLYRLRKGQYQYTAPGFREFLLRRAKNDVL